MEAHKDRDFEGGVHHRKLDHQNRTENSSSIPRNQNQNQLISDDLERNWRDMENSYRQRYPNIADEDTKYRPGEFYTLTENVARRIKRHPKDVENDIRRWNDSINRH